MYVSSWPNTKHIAINLYTAHYDQLSLDNSDLGKTDNSSGQEGNFFIVLVATKLCIAITIGS